jgi:hypothetical protein
MESRHASQSLVLVACNTTLTYISTFSALSLMLVASSKTLACILIFNAHSLKHNANKLLVALNNQLPSLSSCHCRVPMQWLAFGVWWLGLGIV